METIQHLESAPCHAALFLVERRDPNGCQHGRSMPLLSREEQDKLRHHQRDGGRIERTPRVSSDICVFSHDKKLVTGNV